MSAKGGKPTFRHLAYRRMEDRNRWIMHIKALRREHGVGILEAERIALTDANWRRWVERQINSDVRCRRMALSHIRNEGEAALLRRDGDQLTVAKGGKPTFRY